MRILIAVTHLLGAGHLTRAAALARAFADAGHETVLVSGGMPSAIVRSGRARLVQLPPVRIAGTAFSALLDGGGDPAGAPLLEARRAGLLAALEAASPDVVVTELFPFGRRALAVEFLALVEAARGRRPRPLILASVRDVLVAPARRERIAEARDRLAALYDAVLVHGDPALAPLDASWPVDPGTAASIRYTGYVDEGGAPAEATARAGILVAAGSGPAGLGLFRAAAAAARGRPDLGWRILVGHGVPQPAFDALGRGLPDGVVARARPDYRALLRAAALSVSQCGYNSAVDLLATGTPALFVPFEAGGETEQRLRADILASRGDAVPFWWRDDDAVAASPALDRLLGLAADCAAPLMLAAIPALAEPSLAGRLLREGGISVAVHGLTHRNHAPSGEKPAEFGAHRPPAALVADADAALAQAAARLPPERLLPVFVPPWNRLAPGLAAALPAIGYRGLSAAAGAPGAGLPRADATLDPVDWRGTRSMRDPEGLLDGLIRHVAGDTRRPVGLLTHHRVHDEAVWAFLGALLPLLLRHPAVTVLDPRVIFAVPTVDAGAAQPTSERDHELMGIG